MAICRSAQCIHFVESRRSYCIEIQNSTKEEDFSVTFFTQFFRSPSVDSFRKNTQLCQCGTNSAAIFREPRKFSSETAEDINNQVGGICQFLWRGVGFRLID